MFQLSVIQATLASLTNRVEKHGDDDVPAVSLGLEIECGNTLLDRIDPGLRPSLYSAIEGQSDLPGLEASTPLLRASVIERVALSTKLEGWTLSVDASFDEANPMTFGACKVDKFTVQPMQGGTIALRFRVGTADIDAERCGMLGMHVGQDIWISLAAPEPAADAIDASSSATDLPASADATELFAGLDTAASP